VPPWPRIVGGLVFYRYFIEKWRRSDQKRCVMAGRGVRFE